jgi:hypothetical protein
MNADITLTDLESAINFWRQNNPSVGDEMRLCPEAAALATPYAYMILKRKQSLSISDLDAIAQTAIEQWRAKRAAL